MKEKKKQSIIFIDGISDFIYSVSIDRVAQKLTFNKSNQKGQLEKYKRTVNMTAKHANNY